MFKIGPKNQFSSLFCLFRRFLDISSILGLKPVIWITDSGPWVTDSGPWVTDSGLWVTDFGLWITDFGCLGPVFCFWDFVC